MQAYNCLIPLDGSAFSRQILPFVRRLLPPEHYTITLLRVAAPPEGVGALPPRPLVVDGMVLPEYETAQDAVLAKHPIYASQADENVRAALEDELQADVYYLEAAGFTVKVLVKLGDPAEEIIDLAEQGGSDLVAMATHGRTGLPRLVLGSVAEEALRRLAVPVLLVRPFAHVKVNDLAQARPF
ncbi:MAG TPA: universal stress protein [Herpetosiphonaceae bacterium]